MAYKRSLVANILHTMIFERERGSIKDISRILRTSKNV